MSIQSLRDIIRDHDYGIVRGLASIDNLEENILDWHREHLRIYGESVRERAAIGLQAAGEAILAALVRKMPLPPIEGEVQT